MCPCWPTFSSKTRPNLASFNKQITIITSIFFSVLRRSKRAGLVAARIWGALNPSTDQQSDQALGTRIWSIAPRQGFFWLPSTKVLSHLYRWLPLNRSGPRLVKWTIFDTHHGWWGGLLLVRTKNGSHHGQWRAPKIHYRFATIKATTIKSGWNLIGFWNG